MGVSTKLETVDARKAQKFLDSMAANRPLSEVAAKVLADMITNGEWEVNGETIKFDNKGHMIDGQHRCWAVILAGKGIKTFVTRGLNSVSFDTIDTGRKRTVGQVFAKYGEANYAMLAGAVAWLNRFQLNIVSAGRQSSPSHKQARAILNANPGLRDSTVWGQRCRRYLPPALTTALHYLFAKKSQDDADFFFEHLSNGENLSASSTVTSGIHWLRNRLDDNRSNVTKLPIVIVVALTIKAWNAMRSRRVVKTLKMNKGGGKPESFPEIQ